MLKKPSDKNKVTRPVAAVSDDQADQLASMLADKPYGDERKVPEIQEKLTRTTISLPESLLRQCEDLALNNKRSGLEPKNVSALVRAALENHFNT